MNSRTSGAVLALIIGKVLFAFLGFSALVTEVATLVARGRFQAGDFFSYFTVEANTLAVISLMVSAFALATGWRSRRLDGFRGAVTLYMTTTIVIFIVLLSGYPASELTAVPWDNTVLHYIMPIAVIVDWLIGDRIEPIRYRSALVWLSFPLAYLGYSLIRGADRALVSLSVHGPFGPRVPRRRRHVGCHRRLPRRDHVGRGSGSRLDPPCIGAAHPRG